MKWTDYFDRIIVINLPSRTDRLLQVTEEMDKYDIPFEIVDGITSELGGAEGLKIVVENIFRESIENKHERILIFEDDCLFIQDPTYVMEQAMKELPDNWDILFLGGQCTNGFKRRHKTSLLQLDSCFATHAWAISLQGMKEIMSAGLEAPIDNCIVKTVQPLQRCFITYPMLATQRESYSDIGNTVVNWRPFLEQRYNQKIAELN